MNVLMSTASKCIEFVNNVMRLFDFECRYQYLFVKCSLDGNKCNFDQYSQLYFLALLHILALLST